MEIQNNIPDAPHEAEMRAARQLYIAIYRYIDGSPKSMTYAEDLRSHATTLLQALGEITEYTKRHKEMPKYFTSEWEGKTVRLFHMSDSKLTTVPYVISSPEAFLKDVSSFLKEGTIAAVPDAPRESEHENEEIRALAQKLKDKYNLRQLNVSNINPLAAVKVLQILSAIMKKLGQNASYFEGYRVVFYGQADRVSTTNFIMMRSLGISHEDWSKGENHLEKLIRAVLNDMPAYRQAEERGVKQGPIWKPESEGLWRWRRRS